MSPLLAPSVIDVRQLGVQFGTQRVLDIAQLSVGAGEHVALVGPNGAGKSSLLKVLGGFLPITQGWVSVLGCSFGDGAAAPSLSHAQWRALRAQVGQVMQGLHLVARLSAIENVMLGALAQPAGLSAWRCALRCYPSALIAQASDALAELGLAHHLHTRADRLSGGERQKVSLARLRLQQPRLVLADEPTSALDPAATLQACRALRAVSRTATLISVVHDPALLPVLADRVIGLKTGCLAFDLAQQDVHPERLRDLYAAPPKAPARPASLSPLTARTPTDRPLFA